MATSAKKVLDLIAEKEVEWVDLRFTDPKGKWHHLTMTAAQLDEDQLDETHVGLRIMRERAQTIGARLDIVSAPGKGSSVILTLPPNVHPVSSLASTVTTSIEA